MREAQSNLLGQIADRINDILMNIKILQKMNKITSAILLWIILRDIQETLHVHIFSEIKWTYESTLFMAGRTMIWAQSYNFVNLICLS